MTAHWLPGLPGLLAGLVVSLRVTAAALLLGLPLGLALALLTGARVRGLRWSAVALVEIGRSPPTLVVVYVAYFGLPKTGITLPAEVAAVLALAYNSGAYTSEIFRGSLLAVPPQQSEAAAALGLRRAHQLRDVVLPQAVRIAIPPLAGFSITVFQASSLCFVIAVPELMSRAYNAGSVSFDYLGALALAALLYAAIAVPGAQGVHLLERRLTRRI
jgi:polar amino acid transport system permease protein